MKLYVIFLLLFFVLFEKSYSQSVEKYNESMLEVQEYLKDFEYKEALYILKGLESEGYNNANMFYRIGICYLYSTSDKSLAIKYLKDITSKISQNYNDTVPQEITVPAEAYLYLGDAYLVNYRIKEARQAYLKYSSISYLSEKQKSIASARIKNCLFARLQIDNPLPLKLENAGPKINTGIANAHACISSDGKKMVFSRSLKFYDGIYFTYQSDSGWVEPYSILTQVGSDGEYWPTSISPDGNKILFETYVDLYGHEIFESVFNGKKWSKMKKLPEPVNTKFHETDATYGPDGKTIYFSSNRSGGLGGFDIYKAIWDSLTNSYSVENLGEPVNSEGDEKSPSMIDNGKIIVFNSEDKVAVGGYDYFYSRNLGNGKWSEPLNIGYSLNTTSDDADMKFTAFASDKGVLSRFDAKGYTGNDIFFFTTPVFSTLRLIPLSGKIKVSDTTGIRNVSIALYDENTKDTAIIITPDSNGNYSTDLYPGQFSLVIKKDSSEIEKQNILIPSDFKGEIFMVENKQSEPQLPQNKITPVDSFKSQIDTLYICNILFEFNISDISPSEKIYLDQLINKLKDYRVKGIQLIGYTDAIGDSLYNRKLSLERANAVRDYLIKNKYSSKIIICRGEGSNHSIAENKLPDGNDNPNGRAINRRVEINISIDSNSIIIIKNKRLLNNK
jgi:outer membrane protein OmpA-like peptidoglycan-associated protein